MGWRSSCFYLLLVATTCIGCTAPHSAPLSPKRLHDQRRWEFAFYGHHPTCWQAWPPDWMGCPTHGPVVLTDQPIEVLPNLPSSEPARPSLPGEVQSTPGVPGAPNPPPAPLPQADLNQGTSRLPLRIEGADIRSSVQLIGTDPPDSVPPTPPVLLQQYIAPLPPIPTTSPMRGQVSAVPRIAPKSLPDILSQSTAPLPSGGLYTVQR